MKYKQKMIFVFVFFMIALPTFEALGLTIQEPEQVRIGIRSGSSATPITSILSKNGLEIGYYTGNEFNVIEGYINGDELLVRKDSYFMNLNGSFIEYEFDEQKDKDNTNLQGPIHVEIAHSFSSYDDAQRFIETLPSLGYSPYIVSEEGWRVWLGLFISQSDAEKAVQEIKSIKDDLALRVVPQKDKRIQVTDKTGKVLFMYDGENNNYHFKPMLSKDSLGVIKVDGKNFRGSIYFKRYTDSDLTVINQLTIDEYLYGVLPKEISGTWPIEAQKAQAVTARNFTLVKLNEHAKYGFDLCSTTHCQVYGGYDVEHPNSNKAVDQTKGKYLTYNGKLVTAFYHSNSGGRTEDSQNIWSFPLDYIKSVDDPYSIGQPNDHWTFSYTKQQLEDILVSKGLDVGAIISISPLAYSENGRVLKLEIKGSKDKIILEKDKIRNILGYNNIKSTWFELESNGDVTVLSGVNQSSTKTSLASKYVATASGIVKVNMENININNGTKLISVSIAPDKFVFTGKGWGHGLGMSQWGAKTMAEQGFTFEQILTYYYTGTKVE